MPQAVQQSDIGPAASEVSATSCGSGVERRETTHRASHSGASSDTRPRPCQKNPQCQDGEPGERAIQPSTSRRTLGTSRRQDEESISGAQQSARNSSSPQAGVGDSPKSGDCHSQRALSSSKR
eukprot:1609267-Amphidinium_carterae.1